MPAGVPTQSNALEKQNGKQKQLLSFKREGVVQHLGTAFSDLEQLSMGDLQFGRFMARGYTTPQGIVKEVSFTHTRTQL